MSDEELAELGIEVVFGPENQPTGSPDPEQGAVETGSAQPQAKNTESDSAPQKPPAGAKGIESKPSPAPGANTAYGANNKLVSSERAEELRRRLREKLNQLNAGVDPEMIALASELAAYHIEAGTRKFSEFSRKVVDELGEKIKPYLKMMYNAVRDFPGAEHLKSDMDGYASVDGADIDAILAADEHHEEEPAPSPDPTRR